MQLHLNLVANEHLKNSWAFAVDKQRARRRSRAIKRQAMNHCIITACSRQAKDLGVEVGMRYEEAKALLPDMRIIIYGK